MEAAVRREAIDVDGDDACLVRRVQAGEVRAFAPLVTRYQDRVFNLCWRMCGDPEDAGDLTQETFLKAFREIGSFEGKSGFYTWLFRIAVNLTMSHRRRQKLRYVASLDAENVAGGATVPSIPDRASDNAAELATTGEMHAHVTAAIEKLDEHHRTVVVLRDIQGLDYEQIAKVLEVAVGTVKSRVFRARMALREILETAANQNSSTGKL